ncbi:uncharacterized protein LOC113146560 [Cyclospora cayetanensis]|uniref:Uncharacterized protein LOC113146560 n=1 Tax=Cyclospora cayetanensis TaxID=88456 RepID=A0A6P6RR99_9EIME|nr:uncharacterized protein LOC113146560 [Cyclospora cayetanensis]
MRHTTPPPDSSSPCSPDSTAEELQGDSEGVLAPCGEDASEEPSNSGASSGVLAAALELSAAATRVEAVSESAGGEAADEATGVDAEGPASSGASGVHTPPPEAKVCPIFPGGDPRDWQTAAFAAAASGGGVPGSASLPQWEPRMRFTQAAATTGEQQPVLAAAVTRYVQATTREALAFCVGADAWVQRLLPAAVNAIGSADFPTAVAAAAAASDASDASSSAARRDDSSSVERASPTGERSGVAAGAPLPPLLSPEGETGAGSSATPLLSLRQSSCGIETVWGPPVAAAGAPGWRLHLHSGLCGFVVGGSGSLRVVEGEREEQVTLSRGSVFCIPPLIPHLFAASAETPLVMFVCYSPPLTVHCSNGASSSNTGTSSSNTGTSSSNTGTSSSNTGTSSSACGVDSDAPCGGRHAGDIGAATVEAAAAQWSRIFCSANASSLGSAHVYVIQAHIFVPSHSLSFEKARGEHLNAHILPLPCTNTGTDRGITRDTYTGTL